MQISRYRDAWRRRLDREVDRFNPHVIHAGHLWWDAQLALETGVPYVVSAWSARADGLRRPHPLRVHSSSKRPKTPAGIFVPHQALSRRGASHVSASCPITSPSCRRPSIRAAWPARAASRQRWLERFGLPDADGPIVVARATGNSDSGLDVLINAAARCQSRRRFTTASAPDRSSPSPQCRTGSRVDSAGGTARARPIASGRDSPRCRLARAVAGGRSGGVSLPASRPMVWTCCGHWPPARRPSSLPSGGLDWLAGCAGRSHDSRRRPRTVGRGDDRGPGRILEGDGESASAVPQHPGWPRRQAKSPRPIDAAHRTVRPIAVASELSRTRREKRNCRQAQNPEKTAAGKGEIREHDGRLAAAPTRTSTPPPPAHCGKTLPPPAASQSEKSQLPGAGAADGNAPSPAGPSADPTRTLGKDLEGLLDLLGDQSLDRASGCRISDSFSLPPRVARISDWTFSALSGSFRWSQSTKIGRTAQGNRNSV